MKNTIFALLMGAYIGHTGLTGFEGTDSQSLTVFDEAEVLLTPATEAELAKLPDQEIAQGVRHLDSASRKLPGYVGQMAEKVKDHGIIAFVADDPEMTKAGHAIGVEFGTGIRHFANAVARDMTRRRDG